MSDVVVIGGGHNGLAAATLLARGGRRVVLLERRDRLGGIAAGEVFFDGLKTRGVLHDTAGLRPWVVDALGLKQHGLELRPVPALAIGRAGGAPVELGEATPGLDTLRSFVDRLRPFVGMLMDSAPADIGDEAKLLPLVKPALGLRRLGARDMMELLRVAPLCVDDWVAEHVADPVLRAALCVRALDGAWMGPRSPTSNAWLLLGEAMSGQEVVGGPAALVDALVAAAKAAGVELRTGVEVARIAVEGGAVAGVETVGGERVAADVVLSAIGPRRTLLGLLPPLELPALLERDVGRVRLRGTTAKLHLALDKPLTLGSSTPERLLLGAEDPLDLERCFDDVKHRRLPTVPPALQIRQWQDGGRWVASALLKAPFDLDGGWGPAEREALGDAAVGTIERAVPGAKEAILGREVLTPADLAERYGLEGGHVLHGEPALDQVWALRPVPRVARYATPIRGLFLGSSGMHPGYGITAGPGALAARAVLGG